MVVVSKPKSHFLSVPPTPLPPFLVIPQIQELEQLKQNAESAVAQSHEQLARGVEDSIADGPLTASTYSTLKQKLRSAELEIRSLTGEKQGLKRRLAELEDSAGGQQGDSAQTADLRAENARLRGQLILIEAAGERDDGDLTDLESAKARICDLQRRAALLERAAAGDVKILLARLEPEDRAKLAEAITKIHQKAILAQEAERRAQEEIEALRQQVEKMTTISLSMPAQPVMGDVSIDSVEALVRASLERSRQIEEAFLSRNGSAATSADASFAATSPVAAKRQSATSSSIQHSGSLSPARPSSLRHVTRASCDDTDASLDNISPQDLRDTLARHLQLAQKVAAEGKAVEEGDQDVEIETAHRASRDAAIITGRERVSSYAGSWKIESDDEDPSFRDVDIVVRADRPMHAKHGNGAPSPSNVRDSLAASASSSVRTTVSDAVYMGGVLEAARKKVKEVNETRRAQIAGHHRQGQPGDAAAGTQSAPLGAYENTRTGAVPEPTAPAPRLSLSNSSAAPGKAGSPGSRPAVGEGTRLRSRGGPARSSGGQQGALSRQLQDKRLKKVRESLGSAHGSDSRRGSVVSSLPRRDSVASIGFPDAGRLSARGSHSGGTLPLSGDDEGSSEDEDDFHERSSEESEEEDMHVSRDSHDSFLAHNDPRDYFVDDDDEDVDEDPAQRESVGRLQRMSGSTFTSRVREWERWLVERTGKRGHGFVLD
jgi:hypothetical protein